MFTNPFMELAIAAAKEAYAQGEVPVGAVVVDGKTGEVLAQAGNRMEALQDPTAHAEILAIREACQRKGSPRLIGCDLYVSLEPCPMCAQAIAFSRIRRLYFAASDPKGGGVEHGARIFSQSSCHHFPDIYSGIQEAASAQLLKQFFKERRVTQGEIPSP